MSLMFLITGAAILVLAFRFAPRMANPRAGAWLAAAGFCLGGLLLQAGQMLLLVEEGKYYTALMLLAPVIVALGLTMFIPGVLERFRNPGAPAERARGPFVLFCTLLAFLLAGAGIAQLIWILVDAPAVVETYGSILRALGLWSGQVAE